MIHARARRLALRAVRRGRAGQSHTGLLRWLLGWGRAQSGAGAVRFAACLRNGGGRRPAVCARRACAGPGRRGAAPCPGARRAARDDVARANPDARPCARSVRATRQRARCDRGGNRRAPDDAALALASVAPLASGAGWRAPVSCWQWPRGGRRPWRGPARRRSFRATTRRRRSRSPRGGACLRASPLAVDAHSAAVALLESCSRPARRRGGASPRRARRSRARARAAVIHVARRRSGGARGGALPPARQEPDDAWALRELALHFGAQRRFDEAFAICDKARVRAPLDTREALVRGHLELLRGNPDAARKAFRAALAETRRAPRGERAPGARSRARSATRRWSRWRACCWSAPRAVAASSSRTKTRSRSPRSRAHGRARRGNPARPARAACRVVHRGAAAPRLQSPRRRTYDRGARGRGAAR